jgi:drug/metabolite transporter (DMT)-like permease
MNAHTLAGILAIVFWSTNVAFSRSLTEQLGVLTSGAILFTTAGILSLAYQCLATGKVRIPDLGSRQYLFGCGALFVINVVALQLAIGLAATRVETIAVGLINYLWPAISLVLAPVFFEKKVRWFLAVGVLLALSGMYFVSIQGGRPDPGELRTNPAALAAYGFALLAAVTWGLYSNLSRKWGSGLDGNSIPVFLLVSGLLMGLLRVFRPERMMPGPAVYLEMAYVVLFPIILAFVFWDLAMRKGRMILVVSLSYFIPLFSTWISCVRLGVSPGRTLWIGTGLIITGAFVCKAAVSE